MYHPEKITLRRISGPTTVIATAYVVSPRKFEDPWSV